MTLEAQIEPRSENAIRVLLVDEEVVIRAGLRILIDSWPDSQVVGEADSPNQALAAMDAVEPNLIVCSHTGRSNGFFDDFRNLIQGAGETPVVLLAGSRDPHARTRAVQAGAKWIFLKKHAATELRNALERVHSGVKWTDRFRVTNRVAQIYGTRPGNKRWSDPDQPFTKREREVAVLVSQGRTNKQVAHHLGITEVTVRHHLTSIFSKLQIGNRFELIAWLYSNRVVSPAT